MKHTRMISSLYPFILGEETPAGFSAPAVIDYAHGQQSDSENKGSPFPSTASPNSRTGQFCKLSHTEFA